MGWGLVAAWAIVAGSVLLTIGTGAQARANLAEYRDVVATLPQAIRSAILRSSFRLAISVLAAVVGPLVSIGAEIPLNLQVESETATRLAQLARLTAVWTVLMAGSVLVLAGAAIQLALAYTG